MTPEERTRRIESYGAAGDELRDALRSIPREAWDFRPEPGKWTIREIIVHLADAEAHGYIRCRTGIAEPGGDVNGYEQDDWATRLGYADQDPDEALELFEMLRRSTHRLITRLPEAVWANTVRHSTRGIWTLDEWLDTYEQHVRVHVAQIGRNHAAWANGG